MKERPEWVFQGMRVQIIGPGRWSAECGQHLPTFRLGSLASTYLAENGYVRVWEDDRQIAGITLVHPGSVSDLQGRPFQKFLTNLRNENLEDLQP